MKVICQICKEIIAEIKDVNQIKQPLVGSMFASPDEAHGIAPPFFPSFQWEDFRCPHGGHRPLIWPDKILTSEGILNVPKNGEKAFLTQNMGEVERSGVFDRQIDLPPAVSDEQAVAIVRGRMEQETTKPEVEENGEATIREGQPEDSKPIESKEEKETDTERPAGDAGIKCNICEAPFRNRSGLINHRRMVHGIKSREGI